MKITVVTVCYNAGDILEDTIRSVVNQSYEDIEYIVIDGASTDNTKDILEKYSDRISKVISEPDEGIYDAMNKGIRFATGEYINFMNAGDSFVDESVVAMVVAEMTDDYDIYYGNSVMIDYDGEIRDMGTDDISMLRKRPIYRHNASFTRTSLHRQIPFDLSKSKEFKYGLDYNQIFNVWYRGGSFRKIETPIVKWLRDGTSAREVLNVKLCYRISHQYASAGLKDKLIYIFDMIKAYRRDCLKRLSVRC